MSTHHILDHTPVEQPLPKQNKALLFIIGVCLIVGLVGQMCCKYYFFDSTINTFSEIATGIGRLVAIGILIRAGTLLKTRPYSQLIYFFAGVAIIGLLFKIQHWPFADWLLISGQAGALLTYMLRFIKKENKLRLDILKVSWVVLLFTANIFQLTYFPFADVLLTAESILFVILYIDFAYPYFRAGNQAEQQINE